MLETIRTGVSQWNQRTSERQKLQQSYVILLFVVIFIAGLVSLFNATRSRQLMYAALALLITLTVNFVAWGLLQTFILAKLPRQTRTPRR